jgi:hypothetical protein
MVGLALAIRASPNAVGEEATPPEFTFFEAPVYAPGPWPAAVHMCAVLSGDRRSPISPSLFGRKYSARMDFGMPSESPTSYLLSVVGPVATPRMQVPSTSAQRGSPVAPRANNVVYWNQKTKSHKHKQRILYVVSRCSWLSWLRSWLLAPL